MGWVDRHNRFRQDILGLHRTWKTKRWQTRIQLEMIGMAVVDAFLVSRHFQPQWRHSDANTESSFWLYTRNLLPQLSPIHTELLQPSSSGGGSSCVQVNIGKRAIKSSKTDNKIGSKYTAQKRCKYCGLQGRKEILKNGSRGTKSPRTSYKCIKCGVAMCREGKGTCWAEHVAEAAARQHEIDDEFFSDGE